MKKFVVFDEDSGWAARIEAESLESALLFVCEDSAGDFNWSNGDSLKIGEIVFDGKIRVDATDETRAVETSEKLESLPTGTLLEALIDSPLCISGVCKGDVGIVRNGYKILLLQGECADETYWYGDKKETWETFNDRWKIIYTPHE